MSNAILYIVRIRLVRNILLSLFRCGFFRMRRIKKYLKSADDKKLQIGCGPYPLKGWLNTGISLKECWYGAYLDAGKPFPFQEDTFNYVYSEHLFEHLTYQQAVNMLKESYRVLKPGGIFRIATPDLKFLLRLYKEPEKPIHKDYIEYSAKAGKVPPMPVFVISRFHTEWGHQIIYDKETLTKLLMDVGFTDIVSCEVGKSEHKALNGVEGHFKELGEDFNNLETMILEAKK